MVALHVVDAELAQVLQDFVVLDEFGDGFLAERMRDVIDGTHHRLVDRVGDDIAHEGTVDLHVVDRQVLEIRERAEAGAEIVEGELAADQENLNPDSAATKSSAMRTASSGPTSISRTPNSSPPKRARVSAWRVRPADGREIYL